MLLFFIVLFAAGLLPTLSQKYAQDMLPALLGDAVEYDEIYIDPFKGVATFTNLRIKQPADFGPGNFLDTPKATIHFPRMALLRGEVNIASLDLKSPVFLFVRNRTGAINVGTWPDSPSITLWRMARVTATDAQAFYMDEISDDSTLEVVASGAFIKAFDLKLSNKLPFGHSIEELHIYVPQTLLRKTGRQLRTDTPDHPFEIGKIVFHSDILTYEDDNVQPRPLDLGFTNVHVVAEGLILGNTQTREVVTSKVEMTGDLVQSDQSALCGIFGKIGPMEGRDTLIRADLHAVGLQLNSVATLFQAETNMLREARVALGGSQFDLHHDFKGKLKEMRIKMHTSSPRGINTESTIIFGDLEDRTADHWRHFKNALISPDKVTATPSIQNRDPHAMARDWSENVVKRAATLFKNARMR